MIANGTGVVQHTYSPLASWSMNRKPAALFTREGDESAPLSTGALSIESL